MKLGSASSLPVKKIMFRNAVFNNFNDYSTQTGEFTCRVPGLYEFVFSLSGPRSAGIVSLMCNSTAALSSVPSSQSPGRITYSGQAVVWLTQGTRVSLEASLSSRGLSSESSFTGHMLFAA